MNNNNLYFKNRYVIGVGWDKEVNVFMVILSF